MRNSGQSSLIKRLMLPIGRRVLPLLIATVPFVLVGVFAQDLLAQPDKNLAQERSETNQACLGCHDPETESAPAVHMAALDKSPHKDLDCTSCHTSYTPEYPHTDEMKAEKPDCASCHPDAADALMLSVHGKIENFPEDAPTCISCHTTGTDAHAVVRPSEGTRKERVKLCSSCHNDVAKMERHEVDTDAVPSYEASFHGKALLRFGREDTAICTDCHTGHSVLASSEPDSTTNRNNLTKTCGQAGCHVGATMNFANSGFSHLHITVKNDPILTATEWFFKILTFGVLGLLLLGILFDMRVALFGKKPSGVSPPVVVFVALGFATLIASIMFAVFANPIGYYTTIASVGFGVLAAGTHVFTKKKKAKVEGVKRYQRFTVSQRIQHLLTIITFTLLVVTGMPIRYPNNDFLHAFYMAMGGMEVMQVVHRGAAIGLIAVWIYHTFELLWRWKKANFSFDSWTMWPRKRDISDLVGTVKYHLGKSPHPPSYDRFQFREKFDYFAVYWGMPIMVFSGLILWFPVFFGGFLPDIGIPLAYIAHTDESVLAFLTIVTWHFYNTHFKPSSFPMNPVFITGTLTEEEMREEHGDELKRIQAMEGAAAASEAPATTEEAAEEPASAVEEVVEETEAVETEEPPAEPSDEPASETSHEPTDEQPKD